MPYSIVQRLGLDTSDYDRGLQRAQHKAGAFGKAMQSMFSRVGAAIMTYFGINLVRAGIDHARRLEELAKTTGKTIEELQKSGLKLSNLEAAAVARLGSRFERWKESALAAIGKVEVGIEAVMAKMQGQGMNDAQDAEIAARRQAIAELGSGAYTMKRQTRLFGGQPATIETPVLNEEAVQKRVQEILARQVRDRLEYRIQTEKAGKSAVDSAKAESTEKKATLETAKAIKTVTKESNELAMRAASNMSAWRDETRISLAEAAGGMPEFKVSRGVRSSAKQANRLLGRAVEARLRGNDSLADQLQSRADKIRDAIPGARGDVFADQLRSLRKIEEHIVTITTATDD
jgi:hypothetical protein